MLTPHYVTSAWAAFERAVLQTLDPAGRARRLIPLLKTPCPLPLSIDALTRVDFTIGQEWPRLFAALSTPSVPQPLHTLALRALPDLAALPPGSHMPLSHNPLFVGREAELCALIELLTRGATAAIQQPVATTGLGGIGKTQLAIEFVHRYGQFFPGSVFWLSCEHTDAVPSEIARCGGLGYLDLRPDFADLKLHEQVQLVRQAWQLDIPRLLVFDNCEDETLLDRWRPTYGGCRILVTSRRAAWSSTLGGADT